ncbi:MAG: M3 family oligoendopeptidase [Negativicutes bacterium]|nr:M3 family oligoendopeptidase [Negativicutes bacterium]
MLKDLNPVWDLEPIFPGGSDSPQLAAELTALNKELTAAITKMNQYREPNEAVWAERFQEIQTLAHRFIQAAAFLEFLNAADTTDVKARMLFGRFFSLSGQFEQVLTLLNQLILAETDEQWQALLLTPTFQPYQFVLNEMRRQAADKLPPEQENLISKLASDGYKAWGSMYERLVARVKITLIENDGSKTVLSAGQAYNRLNDPDRNLREQLMPKWEAAWQDLADLGAQELNSMMGFRLNLYEARGWDYMKEPLEMNRISKATVDMMWQTISENKTRLVTYYKQKQRLMAADRLCWHDFYSPIGAGGQKATYTEAANFILEQFQGFSPKLAAFAKKAFLNRWVEAENRADKGAGAFCSALPILKESRIFSTYSGNLEHATTIAHELGHAFHNEAMKDLPAFNQNVGMCLAETASNLNELVVAEAAIRHAKSGEEKLALLAAKIEQAASEMLNIHCRYLFEDNFCQARKKGPLSAAELNQMMLNAQKTAYENMLDVWHPTFWLSKGHFHGTSVPFYNFPYTFGFFFATGIYAKAKQVGSGFEDTYIELLQHTGVMTVEQLAMQYLQADLTKKEFWQTAIDLSLSDIDEFMALSEEILAARK